MIKKLCFAAFLFCAPVIVIAQTVEDSVKLAVNNLFAAMSASDSAKAIQCFATNGILQTIRTGKDGLAIIKDEKITDFGSFLARETVGSVDERNTITDIRVDGPLAMVWSVYKFYYKGKFSHCGVNSFQLINTSKGWKIQYLIDTRRKVNCGVER